MKLHMTLFMLACFLAGIVLDMSLSRFIMDIVFIVVLVVIALVLTLMARRPRKKGIPRRKSRVVKYRKAARKGRAQ